MNIQQQQKYDRCINEMLCIAGFSYTVIVIRNYLAALEKHFGDKFYPIRALDDLIHTASILRNELSGPGD